MTRVRSRWMLLAPLILVNACSKEPETAVPSEQSALLPSPDPQDASRDVIPGSYEDWCTEHQVPESACTRCDPALAAAFQATNDWCAEHGLPESQCLPCNPDLKIVRPPKPEGV